MSDDRGKGEQEAIERSGKEEVCVIEGIKDEIMRDVEKERKEEGK